MPLYEFYDNDTDEQWEEIMTYEVMKTFLAEHPNVRPVYGINIIGGQGDRAKTDGGFKDMLSRIADANPGSPLAETHGKKDIKSVKTREAVNKFKKAARKK